MRGFTLIEVMVVIAIIAILALIALPSYHSKLLRDQVIDGAALADIVKKPVAASWQSSQSFPADNATAGLPVAEKIVSNQVSRVTVEDGAIHITYGNKVGTAINGKILTLRPAVVEDTPIVPVSWVCGHASAPEKMSAKGNNRTNIPLEYLPFNCRATQMTK